MAAPAPPLSWADLSPSVQTVFGWARAATPADVPVYSTGLLFGILRAHAGYGEPDLLLAHLGRSVDDLIGALSEISPGLDVGVTTRVNLSDVPELAPDGDLVLRESVNLASSFAAFDDGKVHVPHLFGAILRSGPSARVHSALQTVLGDAKVRASEDYVDFLRELVGNRSVRYDDFLRRHPPAPTVPSSAAPAPPELLVDRERELEEIRAALGAGMVVSLSGPRGIGKTSLARRVASDLGESFTGGVDYVNGSDADAEALLESARSRSPDEASLLILDDADRLDRGFLLERMYGPAIVVTTAPLQGPRMVNVALGPLPPDAAHQLLRAHAPDLPDEDAVELARVAGGSPALLGQLAALVASDVTARELASQIETLLASTDRGRTELWATSGQHAIPWGELEAPYGDRQPHEQSLFRAVGLLESPFSTEQAAAAAKTDAQTAGIVLADLAAVGLVEENEDGTWSLPEPVRTFALNKIADEPDPERMRLVLDVLAAQHGIEPAGEEPPALAGFRSDEPSKVDHIGFSADVGALCSVLIANEVEPPISVGLFGEWGTGKSTFMRLLRDQIRALQADWAGRDDSPFCKNVKQITFNAWNYSDANLWASLVTKIFHGLAEPDPEITGDTGLAAEQRAAIVGVLETAQATIAEKEAQRNEAESRETELAERVQAIVEAQRNAGDRLGRIRPAEVIEQVRKSEKVRSLGEQVLEQAKTKDGDADPIAVARELRSTWGFLVHSARLLGPSRTILFAALTLGLVAVLAIAWSQGFPVEGTVTGVAACLASIAAVARKPVGQAKDAAAAAGELLSGLHEEEQVAIRREKAEAEAEIAQLATQRAQLDAELQQARSEAARAQREIEDIESGRRITRFVEERASSAEYSQHLGLIALIRRDFDQLTELLLHRDDANKPPFDRIILYIDDLDRCRAELVVQVLEAVHLLLALKLFVVVVGVDPRWLAQSLKRHYIGQLGLEDGDEQDPDDDWETTPQNYLEKIFQIPFALQPMGTDGYSRMVGALFEVRTAEPGTAPPDTTSTPEPPPVEEADGEVAPEPVPVATSDETPLRHERARELLRIWPAELAFIQRLGALVPTPRAANRLANTYRIIRVTQSGPDLPRFVERDGEAGAYQAALVLLTIVVGFSEIVDEVFRELREGDHADFSSFVEALAARDGASPRVAHAYERLREGLGTLRDEPAFSQDIDVYRTWVPRVARYSFETARIPWEPSAPSPAPA